MILFTPKFIAACALLTGATGLFGMQLPCSATSGPRVTPVLEFYTSEGCSSCPPADRWAASLKGSPLVVQAFHVGYWDHIGWIDRFAAPGYTSRQREHAARNRLRNIYTPQVVLDGRDWRAWGGDASRIAGNAEAARLTLAMRRIDDNQFEATVAPAGTAGAPLAWAAYWTVTEHGHHSQVKAGENAGEFLQHDFVVRQYTPAGTYPGADAAPRKLGFHSIAPTPGHARQVNLVVFDPQSGRTLQALSLQCTG